MPDLFALVEHAVTAGAFVASIWLTLARRRDRVAAGVTRERVRKVEGIVLAHHPEGRPRVLVVDDEPGLAKVIARHLELDGYAVDVAHTIADARALVDRSHPYVAHVIDITLPDGSGLELLRALRPVQIVHSSASDDVLERVRRDGRADAVVPKTGEIEPLLAALRELRR